LQALKTAAREGDAVAVDAIRTAFQLNESREAAEAAHDPTSQKRDMGHPAREEND
jgi:hypothetical protein